MHYIRKLETSGVCVALLFKKSKFIISNLSFILFQLMVFKMIIKRLKKMLKPIYTKWILLGDYYYDFQKFVRTSAEFNHKNSKNSLEASMTMKYHAIEKALTLPSPRPGFGQIRIKQLLMETDQYYNIYGYSDFLKIVIDSLFTYVKFHTENQVKDIPILNEIEEQISKIGEYKKETSKIGGISLITKTDIIEIVNNFNFESFISKRYSIRDFSKKDVTIDKIETAIKLAIRAPSACNRQPWRVHFFQGIQKNEILKHQNGNRGFSDSINAVLLITGITSSFFTLKGYRL